MLIDDLDDFCKANIHSQVPEMFIFHGHGGCSVVLKPSPLASLTCCALGELVAAAGAPPGETEWFVGSKASWLDR